jgi:hypothetical protein
MRWTIYLILICFAGCTIDLKVRPVSTPKPYKKTTVPSTKKTKLKSTQIVSAEWIESYKKMERESGHTIPDDNNITPVGSGYSVPKAVLDHNYDLSRTILKPTP